MQRLLFGIYLVFFLFYSCGDSLPKDVLSRSKMTDILVEVHLIDGYLNTLSADSSRRIIDGYYQQAFTNYGTDSATFNRSMKYYSEDPILMGEVYDKVSARLMKMDQEYSKIDSVRNAGIQDSVRRVTHLQTLASKAHDLIMNVPKEISKLTYEAYRESFITEAGLGSLIGKYTPAVPMVPAVEQIPEKTLPPIPMPVEEKAVGDSTDMPLTPMKSPLVKPVM
ncbi:DUF4296 domain-containing protein [Sphingobacterium spiritivorum]|uniref:DUF4296 domain-containing protein n=1 Tax=Sphingobacterium spiritivorum TaxID=258 RepID=UPI00191B2004|nr:DUF4296 domain-containing protein [Sphingobacterium spiritivorum]QQT25856.1 DUF4296 domain-containing protein [Sphingobacterium spiritivorum]